MSSFNQGQEAALNLLESRVNIFLTGAAGTGKSYILSSYLKRHAYPILASTGAAAILVGGRTFHGFFGLGIMEGGSQASIQRALENRQLVQRLKKAEAVVIDEISMLSGTTLKTAETIARKVRNNSSPWGGLRIIAVGDFAQLPPVNPYGSEKDWAFLNPVWTESQFQTIVLTEPMRSKDTDFLRVLNDVRLGQVTRFVQEFLNSKVGILSEEFEGTRLFSRKDDVERHNLKRLQKLEGKECFFKTIYSGKDIEIEKFKKHAPISDVISLKKNALVMLRQNNPDGYWVNGSLGYVEKMEESELTIRLMEGTKIKVGQVDFTLLNADGLPVVIARNFPVTLAWAVTIHKAQGNTLEKACMDLRHLWEPGHAYVALSRIKLSSGLFLEGWGARSIMSDPAVMDFYQKSRSGLCSGYLER